MKKNKKNNHHKTSKLKKPSHKVKIKETEKAANIKKEKKNKSTSPQAGGPSH